MKFVQIQQNVFYQSMYVVLTIQAEWDMLASLKWLKSGSKDLKVFKVTSDAMKIKVNTTIVVNFNIKLFQYTFNITVASDVRALKKPNRVTRSKVANWYK